MPSIPLFYRQLFPLGYNEGMRRFQFSLATLILVMSFIAIVVAGFVWNAAAGTFAYLGCFFLFMLILRARACSDPEIAVAIGASIPISLASAIAFTATCSAFQFPVADISDGGSLFPETRAFYLRLLVSIPLGTAVALLIYSLTWPRNRPTPPAP